MADISQIKTPNGTTYNIKDTDGRKEENLQWGGPSQSGDVSPVGMALSCEHSANRLAFINGNALTFEYSSNAGSTWTDYGYSATNKSTFCTQEYSVPVGRASASTEYTTSSRTRITLTAQNGTTGYVYTKPRKILINVSTGGGMQVLVEVRTGTNYQSSGAWTTLGTYTLSGWSGWNDIPLVISTLGGGTTQTNNYWQLRLTFIMTSVHATNKTNANILSLRLFGSTAWTTPTGQLSKTGHIYSFDMSQNVTFPANIISVKSDTKAIVARTGSGTAGSTSGTTQTPALWTFNSGITVANGEIYFIKIPVAGGTYGVWLSLNNGTNYYPVAVSSGKSRFTTHYAKDTVIAVTYESGGKCTCYPKAGGDTTSDVTGIFRVLNDYDANTTYSAISTSELTTGTATTSRTVRADYLKSGINNLIDAKVWTGTQEQYDNITTPDPTVTYYITDSNVYSVSANDITYDNGTSGLSAGTVQNAIDEVNSSTQWVGVDVKTGSTAITLPSTWTELFVLCQYGNSSAMQAQCVQTNIIRLAVDTARVFTFGGATLFAQVKFASETSVSMIYFGVSGTDYTSTSQIRVYAKTA